MLINLDALYNAGYHVDVNNSQIAIYPKKPDTELPAMLVEKLCHQLPLSTAEILVGDFMKKVEAQTIMRVISATATRKSNYDEHELEAR